MSSEAYTVSRMLASINDVMAPVTSTCKTSVSLKRRVDNGVMLDTSPRDIALLDLQAKVKHAAQEVASIQASGGDRDHWMSDKRRSANKAFYEGQFEKAAELYVEALAGLDFGRGHEQRRVCEQMEQIPLTCNLVACLLMTEQWDKARKISDEALRLDPFCVRALSQRAKALTKLARFDEARQDLKNAASSLKDKKRHAGVNDGFNEASLDKLTNQLSDIDRAEKREHVRMLRQRKFERKMMREAVGRLYQDKDIVAEDKLGDKTKYFGQDSTSARFKECLVRWIASILLIVLQFLVGSDEKQP